MTPVSLTRRPIPAARPVTNRREERGPRMTNVQPTTMQTLLRSLLWRVLPQDIKIRLRYLDELSTNLFETLPVPTKRTFIRQAQSVLRYSTFIETGSFLGDTAHFAGGLFDTVHTIELSSDLAGKCRERLAPLSNVTVHEGDSAEVLGELLPGIDNSCLFWLDGHFSGGITARGVVDTPVVEELKAIADHGVRPHAILIDDARIFGTDDAYPTLEEVIGFLRAIDPGFKIGVAADIIWAAPATILHFEWGVSPSGRIVPATTRRSTAPTVSGREREERS
jgi:hypothetical protein